MRLPRIRHEQQQRSIGPPRAPLATFTLIPIGPLTAVLRRSNCLRTNIPGSQERDLDSRPAAVARGGSRGSINHSPNAMHNRARH
jgi:hypothetical protein